MQWPCCILSLDKMDSTWKISYEHFLCACALVFGVAITFGHVFFIAAVAAVDRVDKQKRVSEKSLEPVV